MSTRAAPFMHLSPSTCSHAAVKLGQSLFPLFAVALDLPENFFDDKACFMRFADDVRATRAVN
ncbi:hypothetical protein J3R82DRAFT_9758 [Butyriboletus roseoflavus]|nr:hypothetical protein J3R82DRAFT_9758 [Butyriboletus roseoflavus]